MNEDQEKVFDPNIEIPGEQVAEANVEYEEAAPLLEGSEAEVQVEPEPELPIEEQLEADLDPVAEANVLTWARRIAEAAEKLVKRFHRIGNEPEMKELREAVDGFRSHGG